MKQKNKTKRAIALVGVVFVLSFVLAKGVFAAEKVENKATGPSVSPPIIRMELKSGTTKEGSFIYTNGSDADQTIGLSLRPFVPSDGEKGSPVFADKDGKAITSPLKDWVKLDKDTHEVAKGAQVTIKFKVSVPSNVEAKKYYVAIVAGEKPSDTQVGSGSSVSTEIGVLLVADVQKADLVAKNISYPWYLYAMIAALVLAIILAGVVYFRRD